ncbi:hypothetical protein RSOLAG1IB_10768 [Rhizoctonia solani AG-1 IB]|uniref:C2H2-type domain-containing protein n=1 Tax=Thanatephorus cucumeris (strain AG1-IB / isolate 7/3/14) TaxID=1108050 RepID=A0A0B7G0F4_THACB|nr:hypothetical protein RSOLAG1IB_10768 [Rhizoctonia solani AG-1 IB]
MTLGMNIQDDVAVRYDCATFNLGGLKDQNGQLHTQFIPNSYLTYFAVLQMSAPLRPLLQLPSLDVHHCSPDALKYFLSYSGVYAYDRHRRIYRFDIHPRPRLRRILTGPMDTQITPSHMNFKLDMENYLINTSLELYTVHEQGRLKHITHDSPELAFGAVLELGYLEQRSSDSLGVNSIRPTSAYHGAIEAEAQMPQISILPNTGNPPTIEEIDDYINTLKLIRKSRAVHTGLPSQVIVCPLPRCGTVLARPCALKNHLYFHFRIKPHECAACSIRFPTKANLTRHIAISCRSHRQR